ncbi:unnamed protein product [Trichogramma brassicae]|uniref:Uncharacterized protein n=1 Tax=Trichogramma brassicae TaxID=86971 RepID=A0A6H5I1D4_9HYME|nr:unnamed protein product [Trichogramma brassicae]
MTQRAPGYSEQRLKPTQAFDYIGIQSCTWCSPGHPYQPRQPPFILCISVSAVEAVETVEAVAAAAAAEQFESARPVGIRAMRHTRDPASAAGELLTGDARAIYTPRRLISFARAQEPQSKESRRFYMPIRLSRYTSVKVPFTGRSPSHDPWITRLSGCRSILRVCSDDEDDDDASSVIVQDFTYLDNSNPKQERLDVAF